MRAIDIGEIAVRRPDASATEAANLRTAETRSPAAANQHRRHRYGHHRHAATTTTTARHREFSSKEYYRAKRDARRAEF